jgi:hypothetical protein
MDEKRVIFIQYKCVSENNKFYKKRDRHFAKQMEKMRSIPNINKCDNFEAKSRMDLRICNCPVFVKLCSRYILDGKISPYGVYFPICIWDRIYSESAHFITLDDRPRISDDQFKALAKEQLIGSTQEQSEEINRYLILQTKDQRLKLIFSEKVVASQ